MTMGDETNDFAKVTETIYVCSQCGGPARFGKWAPPWTTTKPTEPGWYWVCGAHERPEICQVYDADTWQFMGEDAELMEPSATCHFLGPLPVPTPPNIDKEGK